MSTETTATPPFLPIAPAARYLGVPVKWLRAEAAAGRIPHLRAGPRLLVQLDAVEQALRDRASGKAQAEVVST